MSVRLELEMLTGGLSAIHFQNQHQEETLWAEREFESMSFGFGENSITINGVPFKSFGTRDSTIYTDGVTANMNDAEANRLANHLRDSHEWVFVDATDDVMAAWQQGKPIDVTPEKLVYDW